MSIALPSKKRPLLRRYVRQPWTKAARTSPALKLYCHRRGYLTPNFTVREMADTQTGVLPRGTIRHNARKHCFNLERLKHELGDISIRIDGPYRTPAHNRAVHGASRSRHMRGDATDHFLGTVQGWVARSRKVSSTAQVVVIAEKIFPGVGNETSGTLHLDSRPGAWVRFVTWRRT